MRDLELPALRLESVDTPAEDRPVCLINRDPAPDESGVPHTTAPSLEIAILDVSTLVLASVQIFVLDRPAFSSNTPQPGFAGARASFHTKAHSLVVTLDPQQPFASQERVEVRVVAHTSSGAQLDETYSFNVEDRTSPRLVAAQAIGPKRIRLSFDEPVRVGVFPTLRPLATPAVTPLVVEASVRDGVVELLLSTEMTPSVRYDVWAPGVEDLPGNACAPPFDRAVFEGFRPPQPEGRRFDLWGWLPNFNRRNDTTGDLRRFVACLQEVADLLLADIDRFTDIFDIERAPERFIDLILQDLGNPFTFDLIEVEKRRLAACLVAMYRDKGTARGIRNAVRFFLGFEVEITAFVDTSLRLGESELGVDWELGTDDRFLRFAFSVRAPRVLEPRQREQLHALVEYLKPAHTHLLEILEPTPPEPSLFWELGISMLGIETTLH